MLINAITNTVANTYADMACNYCVQIQKHSGVSECREPCETAADQLFTAPECTHHFIHLAIPSEVNLFD